MPGARLRWAGESLELTPGTSSRTCTHLTPAQQFRTSRNTAPGSLACLVQLLRPSCGLAVGGDRRRWRSHRSSDGYRQRSDSRDCRALGPALAMRNVRDFEGAGITVVDPWNARPTRACGSRDQAWAKLKVRNFSDHIREAERVACLGRDGLARNRHPVHREIARGVVVGRCRSGSGARQAPGVWGCGRRAWRRLWRISALTPSRMR